MGLFIGAALALLSGLILGRAIVELWKATGELNKIEQEEEDDPDNEVLAWMLFHYLQRSEKGE